MQSINMQLILAPFMKVRKLWSFGKVRNVLIEK